RAEAPQKDEHDDGCENAAFDQVRLNRFYRRFDKNGLVADDFGFETRRQCPADLLQTLLYGVCNCDRVLARLFRDDHGHRGLTVQARFGAWLFGRIFRIAKVAELDCVGIAIRDDEIIEVDRLYDATHRSHREFARAFVDTAAGHFDVLRTNSICNLGHRDVERAHFVRVDPDLDFTPPTAD